MTEHPVNQESDPRPKPQSNKFLRKTLLWTILGAATGAVVGALQYPDEQAVPTTLVLAIAFGVAGAVLSVLVGKGLLCKS